MAVKWKTVWPGSQKFLSVLFAAPIHREGGPNVTSNRLLPFSIHLYVIKNIKKTASAFCQPTRSMLSGQAK